MKGQLTSSDLRATRALLEMLDNHLDSIAETDVADSYHNHVVEDVIYPILQIALERLELHAACLDATEVSR